MLTTLKTPRLTRTLIIATALLLLAGGAALAGGGKKAKHAEGEKIYAVEGDVQKPKRTGGPVPPYPEIAKEERIEGTVVTRILIEKDGTVSRAEVVQSLGEPFDELALEAVRQWSFEPASLEGDAVRVHYNITINYRLDGTPKDA